MLIHKELKQAYDVMEGGLSSRMKVMESLSVFIDSSESVLQAYKELEAYYETINKGFKKT